MSDAKDDIFPTARRPAAPRRPEVSPPATAPVESPTSSTPAPPGEARSSSESPTREKVVLEFGSFREFIDEYSPYISSAGMYLLDSTRQPGDEIAFEVRLSDDFRLIHGAGVVEWNGPFGAEGRSSGAALRFTDLDEPSRRLIARLVDNHRSSGGSPFDIDERPAEGAGGVGPGHEGVPPSAGLGTETIALPVALAGGLEDAAVEESARQATPAEPGAPPAEVEPAPPVELAADVAPIDTQANTGEVEEVGEIGLPTSPGLEDALPPPPLLIDADLVPVEEADFDAAKTQIVSLPEDFRSLTMSGAPDELDLAGPSAESGAAVPEGAFEPAELPHLPDAAVSDEPEELLPEMPLQGGLEEDPLAAVDPARDAMFDLLDDTAAPAVEEDVVVTPAPTPVEMPDETDAAGDYYRASGPPRRRRTTLWLTLCLLAVVLGAAAWRYQDRWLGFLPESLIGASDAVASASSPAVVPGSADSTPTGAAPAADTEPPVAPETGSGEPADPTTAPADTPDPAPEPPDATAGPVQTDPQVPTAAVDPVPPVAAAAPPTATPQPAASAAAGTLPSAGPSRLTSLSSRRAGAVTEILIATDAALSPDGFSIARVAAPPARQVIKIYGPSEPFPREAVAVGSEHVRRLRTGFHRTGNRTEIHVVADLTGPGVVVLGTEVRGSMLIVRFGRR